MPKQIPSKTFNIVLVIAIVAAIIAAGVAIFHLKNHSSESNTDESSYTSDNTATDADSSIITTADQIYDAAPESGNLGEKILGDPATAKVVIYDYADYACSHCAADIGSRQYAEPLLAELDFPEELVVNRSVDEYKKYINRFTALK